MNYSILNIQGYLLINCVFDANYCITTCTDKAVPQNPKASLGNDDLYHTIMMMHV